MYHQEMIFEIVVNRLPDVTSQFTDVTRIPYSDESNIQKTAPVFTDPDGDAIIAENYTISPAPPSTMLTYSKANGEFTFSSMDNSFAGVYTVTLHAYDYVSTEAEHTTQSFTLTVQANLGPVVNETQSTVVFTEGRSETVVLSQYIFSDSENESIYLEGAFVGTAPAITFNNATRTLTSNVALGSVGSHTFTVIGYDVHTDTSNATQTVSSQN